METIDLTPIIEKLDIIIQQNTDLVDNIIPFLQYIVDYGLYITITTVIIIFLLGISVGVNIIKK